MWGILGAVEIEVQPVIYFATHLDACVNGGCKCEKDNNLCINLPSGYALKISVSA